MLHHHKKGHHLIREERYYISIRLNIDHRSVYKIAKELHSAYNTIKQEVQ
ncbi:helix-turn-helix domain-containing protein [uncultured Ruminococcus sp.]